VKVDRCRKILIRFHHQSFCGERWAYGEAIDAIRVIVFDGRVSRKSPLPVDVLLPEITSSLQRNPNLVIEAPPGAGKTTRVPPALLGIVTGEVVVLG
jgi:hypothetical protein